MAEWQKSYRFFANGILDCGEVVRALEDGIPLNEIEADGGIDHDDIVSDLEEQFVYYKREAVYYIDSNEFRTAIDYLKGCITIQEELGITS